MRGGSRHERKNKKTPETNLMILRAMGRRRETPPAPPTFLHSAAQRTLKTYFP